MNANAKGPVVKLPDAPSSLTFPSTQPLSNCPQAAPVMLFARLPIRGGREILLMAPLASFFFFFKRIYFLQSSSHSCAPGLDTGEMKGKESLRRMGN